MLAVPLRTGPKQSGDHSPQMPTMTVQATITSAAPMTSCHRPWNPLRTPISVAPRPVQLASRPMLMGPPPIEGHQQIVELRAELDGRLSKRLGVGLLTGPPQRPPACGRTRFLPWTGLRNEAPAALATRPGV